MFLCIIGFQISAFTQEFPALPDTEVVSIAVTANQLDIDNAGLEKEEYKNIKLKDFLQSIVPALKIHLVHAEKVQKQLGSK